MLWNGRAKIRVPLIDNAGGKSEKTTGFQVPAVMSFLLPVKQICITITIHTVYKGKTWQNYFFDWNENFIKKIFYDRYKSPLLVSKWFCNKKYCVSSTLYLSCYWCKKKVEGLNTYNLYMIPNISQYFHHQMLKLALIPSTALRLIKFSFEPNMLFWHFHTHIFPQWIFTAFFYTSQTVFFVSDTC